MANPELKQVKLPSGNIYDIVDQGARDLIAGINNWTYVVSTDAASTPEGVKWKSGSTTITGTLPAAKSTMYKIYLVPATNTSGDDVYAEYVTVNPSGSTYQWEKMGDTDIDLSNLGDFAYADTGSVTITPKGSTSASSVSFAAHTTSQVLGTGTTASASTSSVSFAAHTTAKVLTDAVTATVPKNPTSTVKHLTASLSGGSVSASTATALTGLGTASTASFVTSYPGASSKLSTTSVTGVTTATTTASKATAGTAVAIAKAGTAVTVGSGALGAETTTRGADTPMWGATVEDGVLSFSFKPLSTTSVTPADSNGTITPYTFSDVTVPVKAASATTVATGEVSANGGGDSVLVGLGTAATANAVTGYATPTSAAFATTATYSSPTVSLSASASTSTGSVKFTEDISSSGTDAVTFSTAGATANAITALGAGTAAAQTISLTPSEVSAITALGAATAAGQTLTGTTETYSVTPVTE